jgi:uncharacterized membrane protein
MIILKSVKGKKMNKTKKILIILAIVFALGDIAWNIYDIVTYFSTAQTAKFAVVYLVFDFIDIAVSIAIMVMLTIAIWGNGKYFRQRYGLYMTSIMLSIIISLFSLSSIFLICSMFVSDIVFERPEQVKDMPGVEVINETKEEKIARLRQKLNNGEITEEEFQKEIMDLL